MKVAIVGGGLASMYAILACADKGIVPDVYTNTWESPVGAVYLRWIPERMVSQFNQHIIYTYGYGSREIYIQKQWGLSFPDHYKSSFPEESVEIGYGYNPADLFDWIAGKEKINVHITDKKFDLQDLNKLSESYSVVFHSFPCGELLDTLHKYMIPIKVMSKENNANYIFIDYDGKRDSIVTRRSCLFGFEYLEMSGQASFNPEYLSSVYKEYTSKTILDIHPNILHLKDMSIPRKFGKLIPIGRLARMERHLLANDNYSIVTEELECLN